MNKIFNYRGSAIHYSVTGSGQPVVLLHGFGEDSRIWNSQVDFLQTHCQVIVPDLPGSGKSELLQSGNGEISIEDYAACIYNLLENERISKCILAGHSMGGYIALAFADKYPERLTAFGLVNSTAFADTEEKKANRKKAMETINNDGVPAFLQQSIPTLFGKTFAGEHPETVEALIAQGSSLFSKEALLQYTQAMMNRPERLAVLTSSEVPVLFILGTEDVAAPLNDVLQQAHLPRVSYIHILKNVGHMGMLEATEQVNNHLLEFIRSVESE